MRISRSQIEAPGHRRRSSGRRLLFAAAAAGLVAILAGGVVTAGRAAASGGTVIFGAEQEPPCLNGLLAGCNNTWTSWTVGSTFIGAYRIRPDFTYEPQLLDGAAKTISKKPFTLLYTIKSKAVWSDGRPITTDDFAFTLAATLAPKNDIAGRSGYDQIRRLVKLSSKRFKLVFKQPYAPHKQLFSGAFGVMPKHVLQGRDFNSVWNTNVRNPANGQPIASGPFMVSEYVRGQSMTLVRNPRWWGKRPGLDRIVFRFITNTDSEIQALRGGEVDAIYPQPQLQLASLRGQSGIAVQTGAGAQLEHIDFNTGPKGFSLARAPWFRQAVAYSIDRNALVKQLFRTLNPSLTALNNLSYVNNQTEYTPHFGRYTLNKAKVASIMKAKNCAKGNDGIYVCNGVRASIKIGTTAGNRLRELAVEFIQAQTKSAGIELRVENAPSRIFFPQVSEENYQLALFAWVTSGDPSGQADVYGCNGGSNWKGYCSKKVTDLFTQADSELDSETRKALIDRADVILANNLPTLPLYQKPTYLVYKTKIKGMKDNPSNAGPVWNIEDWRIG